MATLGGAVHRPGWSAEGAVRRPGWLLPAFKVVANARMPAAARSEGLPESTGWLRVSRRAQPPICALREHDWRLGLSIAQGTRRASTGPARQLQTLCRHRAPPAAGSALNCYLLHRRLTVAALMGGAQRVLD